MTDPSPLVRCRGLSKRFDRAQALEGFDLDVRRGELMVLLGPSGCGKSTALRLIAGLDRPDTGSIDVDGRCVAGPEWVPPERRRIGMVFQDWALFPHLDVRANVAFGVQKDPDRAERVRDVLALVHLEDLGSRMPHELSGGQQQRVAIARALAPSPDVVLLDEPFSNLDAHLRAEVRAEVRRLHRATGTTAVYVTHDQEEALSLADRIAVMAAGRVLQTGTPHGVYAAPADETVARLLGQSNLLDAVVHDGSATTSLGPVPAPGQPDGPARLLLRPESVVLEPDAYGTARIIEVEFYGHDQMARARLGDGSLIEARLNGPHPELVSGAAVSIALSGPPVFYPSPARLRGDTEDDAVTRNTSVPR